MKQTKTLGSGFPLNTLTQDANTMDAAWKLYDAERMANERLRQQLAEKDAEIERLKVECQGLAIEATPGIQLAASKAREQQLREALEKWCNFDSLNMPVNEWFEFCEWYKMLPTDTTALEAIVQRVGEVMRERCMKAGDDGCSEESYLAVEAIRALPGVTLEDLQK